MSNLSVALTFAKNGVLVFPCIEGNSSVIAKAKSPYVSGGYKAASINVDQIAFWWGTWPNAAVGLPCRPNSILVVDADQHGKENGVRALCQRFEARGFDQNSIPVVETPRNGLHCIFQIDAAFPPTKGRLAPGIDVRDNGYVIAAGTEMAVGLKYRLKAGTEAELAYAIYNRKLLPPPDWLDVKRNHQSRDSYIPKEREGQFANDASSHRVSGLVRRVLLAPHGERNSTLYWAVRRLGEMVAKGTMDLSTAYSIGNETGRMAGLHQSEIRATVQSALAAKG